MTAPQQRPPESRRGMVPPAPIRPAVPEDLPACARIVNDWERSTGYLPEGPGLEVITRAICDAFPAREIFVIGEPVAGYISIDPAEGKIGALYLTRPGLGDGRRLMDLAKTGRDSLWLTVYERNRRAQAFYRREGFVLAERLPSVNGAPDQFRMEWHR